MMSKAKIFIELEIEINKTDHPNDASLEFSEIAHNACGGVRYSIEEAIKKIKEKQK